MKFKRVGLRVIEQIPMPGTNGVYTDWRIITDMTGWRDQAGAEKYTAVIAAAPTMLEALQLFAEAEHLHYIDPTVTRVLLDALKDGEGRQS